MSQPQPSQSALSQALPATTREIEDFVAAAGWDQQPQLFALVATMTLLAGQPELADQLDAQIPLTPVAQDALPEGELDVLAGLEWPDSVAGCALAQEIVVLPPEAEAGLADLPDDPAQARRVAACPPAATGGQVGRGSARRPETVRAAVVQAGLANGQMRGGVGPGLCKAWCPVVAGAPASAAVAGGGLHVVGVRARVRRCRRRRAAPAAAASSSLHQVPARRGRSRTHHVPARVAR